MIWVFSPGSHFATRLVYIEHLAQIDVTVLLKVKEVWQQIQTFYVYIQIDKTATRIVAMEAAKERIRLGTTQQHRSKPSTDLVLSPCICIHHGSWRS
jgi:hypothetical protein